MRICRDFNHPPERLDSSFEVAAGAIEEMIRRHETESAMEDLTDKIDRNEKFFSMVGHDLRSPLTVVKACADLIRRFPDDDEVIRNLPGRIIHAVDRADALIRNLLDSNRLQTGHGLDLRFAPCELDELIQQIISDLALVHGRRCEFQSGILVRGRWDRAALRRAIENLITNAFKYGAPDSPVTVELSDGDPVRISVHNWGRPIDPEEVGRLFQWHGRTDFARATGKSGWGLGLMLVKGIVEGHRGAVRIESSADQGTRFTIQIPRDRPLKVDWNA